MSDKAFAVIVDIVGSREASDRRQAQDAVHRAFAESLGSNTGPALYATVGDEFQVVYPTLADALRYTLLARLLLPEGVDVRTGMGEGEIRDVSARVDGVPIQDGSAWWSAREAIDEAHRREERGSPYVRSWFVSADAADAADRDESSDCLALVGSHLLLRDQLVSRMTDRARRLTAGTFLGIGQDELARREGISQSAVSQSLHRYGGAALYASLALFER